MAFKFSGSTNSDTAQELINKLKGIRNTVRDERYERLSKETEKTVIPTYLSGQVDARHQNRKKVSQRDFADLLKKK